MFCPKFTTIEHSMRTIYDEYLKEVPKQIQSPKNTFLSVNKKFAKMVADKVLLESETVKIPIIGSIRIKKFMLNYNKRKPRVNFPASKKAGAKIYFLNEDRGGYTYKWQWDKNFRHKYIQFYSYLPAKYSVRRRLPQVLKAHPEIDYFL